MRSKGITVLLLALVLLACHGAYGAAAHQLLFESAVAAEGHVPHTELPAGEASHGEGSGAASYAAVLLLVLTAVFWVRFGSVLTQRGMMMSDLLRRRFSPSIPRLSPRVTEVSFLQMFRL